MSNISSMCLYTLAKKGLKKEEEKEKKIFEQEEMKEEAHQFELKSQYEIDKEDRINGLKWLKNVNALNAIARLNFSKRIKMENTFVLVVDLENTYSFHLI